MKKTTATILSALALTSLAFAGAGFLTAQKNGTKTAYAEAPATNVSLVSPAEYKQYLALNTPTDVAVSDGYTAIADGHLLFVYSEEDGVYRKYEHSEGVHKLQIDGEDLYFSDAMARLFRLSLPSLGTSPALSQITGVSCSTFLVQDGTVYYTTVVLGKTTVYAYTLLDGTTEKLLTLDAETPLAYGKDGLHYLRKNGDRFALYALDAENSSASIELTSFSLELRAMAFADNLFCFITADGDFYSYDYSSLKENPLAENAEFVSREKGDFTALCANGGAAYAIRKNSVREYLAENADFTDFEICSSSASASRLHGATETLLSENYLFIADGGNDRISVYNTETNAYEKPINSTLPTPFLASYGKTLLAASASEAILYDLSSKHYGETKLTLTDEDLEGDVVGIAGVYDRYYILTSSNYCYALSSENGVWSAEASQKKLHRSAVGFTADVFGSLYIAYNDDDVYRFTEKELLSPSENGVKILNGLADADKLAVDYETNLYALCEGSIVKYAETNGVYEQERVYTPNYGLVCDDSPKVISFAFGVEDEYAYLLYDGDYIVKTDELQIPVVNPIPVGNAMEAIFGNGNTEFSAVTVAENSILIEFDVEGLKEAEKFPYVAFERAQAPQTALKIGEENGYAILCAENGRTGEYKTYLALNGACTPMEESDYRKTYTESKTGYLTSGVSLYKFPYLCESLTVSSLPRGAEVTIVGEVFKLDRSYYEIEYAGENGEKLKGYIPQAFATLFNGESPTPKNESFGVLETDDDAVWRCAYLLLGLGAIGILVDFLILRKRKDD